MKDVALPIAASSQRVDWRIAVLVALLVSAFAAAIPTIAVAESVESARGAGAESGSGLASLLFAPSSSQGNGRVRSAEDIAREKSRAETLDWLRGRQLTNLSAEREAWPRSEETCSPRNLRMAGRPSLRLDEGVADALKSAQTTGWSFVRFDVEADGRPVKVVAIDSAGLPAYDSAAVAAVQKTRFRFASGADLAKGCLAFFSGPSYVGVGPRMAARISPTRRETVGKKSWARPNRAFSRASTVAAGKRRSAPADDVVRAPAPATPYGALPVGPRNEHGRSASSRTPAEQSARVRAQARSERVWTPARDPADGEFPDCTILADRLSRPARCQ